MISTHTFWLMFGSAYILLSIITAWLGYKEIKDTVRKINEYQAQKEKEKNAGDAQPHSW